jgi:hypothetical protein
MKSIYEIIVMFVTVYVFMVMPAVTFFNLFIFGRL